jgi:cyclopropane fatty-acyl-phospholipid synthase-like methyltransferase
MRLALLSLLALAACSHSAPRHDEHKGPYHAFHRFERAEDWVARFEDPSRDAWQKPDEVIKALALPEGATVADIGAATGYFPVRFAHALPQGRVFGIDIERSMVDYLAARAEREGLANLQAVLGAPDDPKIPEPVDLVIVVDTYHHLSDRTAYFRRLATSLKPGGRVAIIDFKPESKMGPVEKLPPAQVTRELLDAGFSLVAEPAVLSEQYFLIFAVGR